MTFGAEIWGPILASAASSYLTNKGKANGQTDTQKKQAQLTDQVLASINGNGPFKDLFEANDDLFNKSFVEPAKARFKNQIAPTIQQSYIATGQEGSTGLEDALTRAGVDLNSQLNQYAYGFNQDAMNRKQNAITGILGQGAGAPNQTSTGQDIMSGLGGYLATPGFSDQFSNLFKQPQVMGQNGSGGGYLPRKGYAQ